MIQTMAALISREVHRFFWGGVFLLFLSGLASLIGLVLKSHSVSVVGAFLMPFAFLSLSLWIERGHAERKARQARAEHAAALVADGGPASLVTGDALISKIDAGCAK